jgi:hypothetical protein
MNDMTRPLFMKIKMAAVLMLASLTCVPSIAACVRHADGKLVLQGDVAVDRKAGLVWKRCAVGREWDARANRCIGRPVGLSQNEAHRAARAAGAGWRVPSGGELQTLRLDACKGPKIDSRAFPDIALSDFGEGANFWTSSAAMPGTFYFFDFIDGSVDFHSAGFALSVLLVRNVANP